MLAERIRMANRRPTTREALVWENTVLTFDVGWRDDGTIGEIFVDGLKSGSALDATLDEQATQASWLLQLGATVAELAQAHGAPVEGSAAPGPMAAMMARAVVIERQEGRRIREAMALARAVA